LGLGDGLWCWIETRRGRCLQKAKLDASVSPYTVAAQHGWWFPELPESEPWLGGWFMSNINMCTDNDPDNCCRLSGVYNVKLAQCNVHRADDVPFRSLFG
ncbi:MAG: molybdopterin dinucleotide binding domain-containing protein, partial [Gordonibacter urolithinfaciens]